MTVRGHVAGPVGGANTYACICNLISVSGRKVIEISSMRSLHNEFAGEVLAEADASHIEL